MSKTQPQYSYLISNSTQKGVSCLWKPNVKLQFPPPRNHSGEEFGLRLPAEVWNAEKRLLYTSSVAACTNISNTMRLMLILYWVSPPKHTNAHISDLFLHFPNSRNLYDANILYIWHYMSRPSLVTLLITLFTSKSFFGKCIKYTNK